jgi:hypothetical protein
VSKPEREFSFPDDLPSAVAKYEPVQIAAVMGFG